MNLQYVSVVEVLYLTELLLMALKDRNTRKEGGFQLQKSIAFLNGRRLVGGEMCLLKHYVVNVQEEV